MCAQTYVYAFEVVCVCHAAEVVNFAYHDVLCVGMHIRADIYAPTTGNLEYVRHNTAVLACASGSFDCIST